MANYYYLYQICDGKNDVDQDSDVFFQKNQWVILKNLTPKGCIYISTYLYVHTYVHIYYFLRPKIPNHKQLNPLSLVWKK